MRQQQDDVLQLLTTCVSLQIQLQQFLLRENELSRLLSSLPQFPRVPVEFKPLAALFLDNTCHTPHSLCTAYDCKVQVVPSVPDEEDRDFTVCTEGIQVQDDTSQCRRQLRSGQCSLSPSCIGGSDCRDSAHTKDYGLTEATSPTTTSLYSRLSAASPKPQPSCDETTTILSGRKP